jgi:T4 RnlA family RNA ligase
MQNFEKQVYEDLENLIKEDESFFGKVFKFEDKSYKIYNYHLANWTSFGKPNAKNARGIMYDITDLNDVKLVSLPPEKFFNYEEGNVDHTSCSVGDKMVKLDGSLISTYLHKNALYLKSKGSLFSSQALDAMNFLNKDENFKNELEKLVKMEYTVNLEYTSPENRVVIGYDKENLTILSARNHKTGENLFATKLKNFLSDNKNFDYLITKMVESENLSNEQIEQLKFVEDIRQEQSGEGYVIELINEKNSSYLVKVKNLKYISLHHTKDSVNSPRRLFEAVINEATDDLRSLFSEEPYMINKINEMEKRVQPIYNHIVNTVENFYDNNKSLERKEFALKAKAEVPDYFGLIMNKYTGKKLDFKDFAIKHRVDVFKITEEEPELDDDGNIIYENGRKKLKSNLS